MEAPKIMTATSKMGSSMESKKIASWARSMAQLMEQDKVTEHEVEMVLDAHGLQV